MILFAYHDENSWNHYQLVIWDCWSYHIKLFWRKDHAGYVKQFWILQPSSNWYSVQNYMLECAACVHDIVFRCTFIACFVNDKRIKVKVLVMMTIMLNIKNYLDVVEFAIGLACIAIGRERDNFYGINSILLGERQVTAWGFVAHLIMLLLRSLFVLISIIFVRHLCAVWSIFQCYPPVLKQSESWFTLAM